MPLVLTQNTNDASEGKAPTGSPPTYTGCRSNEIETATWLSSNVLDSVTFVSVLTICALSPSAVTAPLPVTVHPLVPFKLVPLGYANASSKGTVDAPCANPTAMIDNTDKIHTNRVPDLLNITASSCFINCIAILFIS